MSAAWHPEMDHLRRRVEALEKMLCQGHPAGVACGVCRPEPVLECCTDGTCPTCAPMMAWTDYRKDYQPRDTVTASKAFFAGWEAYPDHHRDTPDPEPEPEPAPVPVPEWREWVTAQHDEVVGSRASALEDVLMCLSEVERGASKNYALARIVARCEREIGDGWQADPDRVRRHPRLQILIDALPVWTTLGNRAASWLRDLTDGGSDE